MSIEAMKQAYQILITEPHSPTACDKLEAILRQAIAEAEKQEPVAWNTGVPPMWPQQKGGETFIVSYEDPQPKREWVGLTLEEIWDSTHGFGHFLLNCAVSIRIVMKRPINVSQVVWLIY